MTEATPEVVAAVQRLVPQLSRTATPPSRAEVAEIVASPATVLFVARRGPERPSERGDGPEGEIVGCLTLALFRIPTGLRAWIEDVVVDRSAQRRGVGTALTRAAVARAELAGARTIDLTSRATREEANRLYQRVGFQLRDTNVYRFSVE